MRWTVCEGKDEIPGMEVKAFMDGKEDDRRLEGQNYRKIYL